MSRVEVICSCNKYNNFPKKHYENIFSERLINELHAWIENHPNVIHSPNLKDSVFVKINGTLVKKKNHIIQILVREIYIFPHQLFLHQKNILQNLVILCHCISLVLIFELYDFFSLPEYH